MRLRVLLGTVVLSVSLFIGGQNVHADVTPTDTITPTNVIVRADDGSNVVDYMSGPIVASIIMMEFMVGLWMGTTGIRLE